MAKTAPVDTILNTCQWVGGLEALHELQPNCFSWLAMLEEVRLSEDRVWCFPICFTNDLQGPLDEFLHATLSHSLSQQVGNGKSASPEAADGLMACLVDLLMSSPSSLDQGHLQIFLELSRQSAEVLSGARPESRFQSLVDRLQSLGPVEAGLVRRRVVRGLIRVIQGALRAAQAARPQLGQLAVVDQFEACALVFSHAGVSQENAMCFAGVGAELGIAVDGQLLQELDTAVATSIQGHLKAKGAFSQALRERLGSGPVQSVRLLPDQLARVLSGLQNSLSVRDLRRAGMEKARAKNLLWMQSIEPLVAVYQSVVSQLRSLDVLTAWTRLVLPVEVNRGALSTPLGPLVPQVSWAFRVPRVESLPTPFWVVKLQMGPLLEAASKRSLRDQNHKVLAAVWGLWESLVQEAEAVGGLTSFHGGAAAALFEQESQAAAFARSAKRWLQVPISLSVDSDRPPVRLTGVSVPVEQTQCDVYGGWSGGAVLLWGPIWGQSEPVRQESEREGFSILTEVLESKEIAAPVEERPAGAFDAVDWKESTEDKFESTLDTSESTLDNFFLPSKQVRQQINQGFSLGLSLSGLVELFREYRHHTTAHGGWVFGRPEQNQMTDRHVYSGDLSAVEAVKSFLLDKYKEGFSPRSDLTGVLPDELQLKAIEGALLGRALEEIEEGNGE